MSTVCSEPGCPELVERGACSAHTRTQRDCRAQGLTGARGSTRRWRKTRSLAIRRDGYRCTRCPARFDLHVHHKNGDAMNDSLDNLITLCAPCHRQIERIGRAA